MSDEAGVVCGHRVKISIVRKSESPEVRKKIQVGELGRRVVGKEKYSLLVGENFTAATRRRRAKYLCVSASLR